MNGSPMFSVTEREIVEEAFRDLFAKYLRSAATTVTRYHDIAGAKQILSNAQDVLSVGNSHGAFDD